MRNFLLLIVLFLFTKLSFSAVPPEVKQDYTPPKAQTGYGNTLFESANQFCQHCHYDLHETWQNSMHGNSWKDPIFQKLYQKFLKFVVSQKVGLSGPTGTFDLNVAKKVGKVCYSCHAPAALYSQDIKLTIEEVQQKGQEVNLYNQFNPDNETILYATNKNDGKTYKITYHIGNPNNREGINCALCHSIEEIKMAHPGDTYTLASPIKTSPIGNTIYPAGYTLRFDNDVERNAFFKLIGPEIYQDYADTRNSQKVRDGRFRIKPIPLDGTDGNIHYAGGPYYGPFGVTALDNIVDNDATDRRGIANTSGFSVPDNHYNNFAKTLCLSCHQRSAGTIDKNPENTQNLFMELCTTFNAIDQNPDDTQYTPKCTKCHMEKRTGILINKWKQENVPWDLNEIPTEGIRNIQSQGIFFSHQFEGASSPSKVSSGVELKIKSMTVEGNKVKVEYYIKNKTAHMFPGAHPMRRVFTILKVYDGKGNPLRVLSAEGKTEFQDVLYTYYNEGFAEEIKVSVKKRNQPVEFLGKVEDINGQVCSQWIDFDMDTKTGTKRIIDICDNDLYAFSRVYGRELFDIQTGVIKPGFAANTTKDNRLAPNEVEIYTVYFELPENAEINGLKAELKGYYHKTGATGIVPTNEKSWIDLDQAKQMELPIYLLSTDTTIYSESSGDGGCSLGNKTDFGLIVGLIVIFSLILYRNKKIFA